MSIFRKKREFIFNVHIDYNYEAKKEGRHLNADFEKNSGDRTPLRQDVENLIHVQLPKELEQFFGLRIKTHVLGYTPGSITIFFSAVLGSYYFVANYKNFIEGAQLIRRHAERLMNSRIHRKWDSRIDTNVNIEFPSLDKYRDKELKREPYYSCCKPTLIASLIANVILLSILGALVYSAVMKVYFP
jgi:hypothetical protein